MTRRLLIFLLVLAMAAPLAACGRKAPLVTPPGSDYPRKYPTQ
jgi:predicted small lipoprotein YifL